MRTPTAVILLLVAGTLGAQSVKVDRSSVTSERRQGREWIVLDSQASTVVPTTLASLLKVLNDYDAYPRLFPRIREAQARTDGGEVLLTEKVVVSALGIENVNRFTLKMVSTETVGPPRVARLSWTQGWTDGTIDNLEGHWILEDRSSASGPQVAVTYWTRSAVPVVVFGQAALVGFFLGGETRSVVEAVVKAARNE